MDYEPALELIAVHINEMHGPRGSQLNGPRIANVIGQLVTRGVLQPGQQLPTVRALSRRLHVSPGTVSDAWRVLRAHAVISTDRRRGTIVRSSTGNVEGRYWHVPVAPGTLAHDFSMGTPDPALLPPLAPALQKVQLEPTVTSYLDHPVIPELDSLLRSRWPFTPEELTIVDGAQDGLDRVVSSLVRFGDAVIVDALTFPPIIDMLEIAGARLLVVRSDADGPLPDEFARALSASPVAAFIQPRAHNPTSVSITAERAREIAEVVSGHPVVLVEDDHSGQIAGVDLHSLGEHLPEQTVLIHSFSKSHGPDLRLAAIGGAAKVLSPLIRRRRLGPSWTSRLLQRVLLELLRDPEAEAMVAEADRTYLFRRAALIAELQARDIEVDGQSGMNVWIPVKDDQKAVVSLAAQGIGVAPGRPFAVEAVTDDHIRVTISSMRDEFDVIADKIATAAR